MEGFMGYRPLDKEQKKARDRLHRKQGWCGQLKRAQRYLGLRPQEKSTPDSQNENGGSDPASTFNSKGPASFPFHQEVVFLCVDVESYERDHSKVTEIGISTLDVLELTNLPPGDGGSQWMDRIRSRHFRIVENGHLHNTEFVSGCAERFHERFGTSEWISIREAPQVIAACFRPPYSAPGQYTSHPADWRAVPRDGSNIQPLSDAGEKRNVVLVGHEVSSDVNYLRRLGYNVNNLSNLIDTIDTAALFRALKREQDSRNLGRVLYDLDLDNINLHNAGNDAAYTTQAMIATCIEALNLNNRPSEVDFLAQLDEDATDKAKTRAREEHKQWQKAERDEPEQRIIQLVTAAPPREPSPEPVDDKDENGITPGQDCDVGESNAVTSKGEESPTPPGLEWKKTIPPLSDRLAKRLEMW